jgi:hypothetical protein
MKTRRFKCIELLLSLVLCGCKTWSSSLREDLRLQMFYNKVLKRVFGSKREEVKQEDGESNK